MDWFRRAAEMDTEEVLDASDRIAALTAEEFSSVAGIDEADIRLGPVALPDPGMVAMRAEVRLPLPLVGMIGLPNRWTIDLTRQEPHIAG